MTNTGTAPVAALRLLVGGLAAPDKLYNAAGTNGDGRPYVQHNGGLAIGSNVVLTLEYYVPSRNANRLTNLMFEVQAVPLEDLATAAAGVPVDRYFPDLRDPNDPRFVIEWASISSR